MSPLYVYACPNGHEVEELRREVHRNEPFPCEDCNDMMTRKGLELQKRPHVQSGTSNVKYRN